VLLRKRRQTRKQPNTLHLVQTYVFVPIAVETMGAIDSDGLEFLGDLGRRITQVTDDIREFACLPVPASVSFYSALQCGRHPGHL